MARINDQGGKYELGSLRMDRRKKELTFTKTTGPGSLTLARFTWLSQRGLICTECNGRAVGGARVCMSCLGTGIPPIPWRELGKWPTRQQRQ